MHHHSVTAVDIESNADCLFEMTTDGLRQAPDWMGAEDARLALSGGGKTYQAYGFQDVYADTGFAEFDDEQSTEVYELAARLANADNATAARFRKLIAEREAFVAAFPGERMNHTHQAQRVQLANLFVRQAAHEVANRMYRDFNEPVASLSHLACETSYEACVVAESSARSAQGAA